MGADESGRRGLPEDQPRRLPVLGAPTVDAAVCASCGGKCCKAAPGIASPEDFGAPDLDAMRSRLLVALRSGRYAIDWWEGDPRPGKSWDDEDYLSSSEYVRPAVAGHEGELRHPGWGGKCTFLGETGCALEHDARPRNCRGLVPSAKDEGSSCAEKREGGSTVEKVDYVLAWVPYADLLEEIQDEVRHAAE